MSSRTAGTTALVHGVAVAGAAVARALVARGYRVLVADDSPDDAKRELAGELGTDLVERPDADTIGAMAGAIWGAANGVEKLPSELLAKLEQRDRLLSLATLLHQRATEV